MKALFTLLALVGALQFAAGAAGLAAAFQRAGSAWADTVGFSGLGFALAMFIGATIYIWRAA